MSWADVDERGRAVGREAEAGREAVRITGGGEQTTGLRRIVLEVAGALPQLRDRHRPLLEGRGHGRVQDTDALEDGVDDPPAIDRHRDGLADAHVAERLLVCPHRHVGLDVGDVLRRAQPGPPLPERVLDLHPVGAPDRAREIPAEVVLSGQERRHARGVVLVDEHLDPVDVGQPRLEVLRVAHEGEPRVGPVAVEHPRPGADHRFRLLEVAVLLDHLAGHDGHRHRARQHLEKPDVGFLEHEPHRVRVGRLHPLDCAQHVGARVALDREEALDRVFHVRGRELAPVHGRLGVPAHAAA